MYCKTNNKITTWKVWRAHGEIAEYGQTRYSQEERKTDGWESPIWEEHPWSLAFLNCLRIIRKSSSISSSGNIEVQTVRWIQEMCASMSLAFSSASHHTAVRLRLGLLKTGAYTALWLHFQLRVVEDGHHLRDRRSPAWSQRARVSLGSLFPSS